MADEYIRREDASDAVIKHLQLDYEYAWGAREAINALPSADAIPYSIESDGTLTITVPKGTYKNINRVLVEEDGTHWGGLYYAD